MNSFKIQKKHLIKIPQNIDVIYCKRNGILTFIGPLKKKSLKVENKILFIYSKNLLGVSHFFINNRNIGIRNAKILQGTIIAKIKYILIEIRYNLYSKLKFIGVGYRAFSLDTLENQYYFKLGYSHLIYFKIPDNFNSHCSKFTKLFLFGNVSYENLTQTTALIRDCKKPEPYKGKGILYYDEELTLKKGKKI